MSNKTPSFAEAYAKLQKLTQEFETGNLDLEVAVPKFKMAADLAKFLKKRLTEIEVQIEEISLDLERSIQNDNIPDNKDLEKENVTEDIPF